MSPLGESALSNQGSLCSDGQQEFRAAQSSDLFLQENPTNISKLFNDDPKFFFNYILLIMLLQLS